MNLVVFWVMSSTRSDDERPADPENNDFKLDPEARSFRLSGSEATAERRSNLPRLLLGLGLLIGLYAAFPELQGAVLGVVAGLAIGYRAGVGAGKRQERAASLPLPPVSDQVAQLAREQGLIPAIKLYRQETGADLSQAKRAVEACLEADLAGRSDH